MPDWQDRLAWSRAADSHAASCAYGESQQLLHPAQTAGEGLVHALRSSSAHIKRAALKNFVESAGNSDSDAETEGQLVPLLVAEYGADGQASYRALVLEALEAVLLRKSTASLHRTALPVLLNELDCLVLCLQLLPNGIHQQVMEHFSAEGSCALLPFL